MDPLDYDLRVRLILRDQAWQRAKAELRSMLAAYYSGGSAEKRKVAAVLYRFAA